MAEEKQANDTIRRANRQIERIEELIDELLADVDISEMTGRERIESAAKLMGQEARMLMVRQSVEAGTSAGQTNIFLAALQRQMRGEIVPALIETQEQT